MGNREISLEEELTEYFISMGVDRSFLEIIYDSTKDNGVDGNRRIRIEICKKVIDLCLEEKKDIPKIVGDVICASKNNDDYRILRVALNEAIAHNREATDLKNN